LSLIIRNTYTGLARGPIDHNASSVINAISEVGGDFIEMGAAVKLTTPGDGELLPRVQTANNNDVAYGIAVGGNADGLYPVKPEESDFEISAAVVSGQGVIVVTEGRCIAKVLAGDNIMRGDILSPNINGNLHRSVNPNESIIATALQDSTLDSTRFMAVYVQRQGLFT